MDDYRLLFSIAHRLCEVVLIVVNVKLNPFRSIEHGLERIACQRPKFETTHVSTRRHHRRNKRQTVFTGVQTACKWSPERRETYTVQVQSTTSLSFHFFRRHKHPTSTQGCIDLHTSHIPRDSNWATLQPHYDDATSSLPWSRAGSVVSGIYPSCRCWLCECRRLIHDDYDCTVHDYPPYPDDYDYERADHVRDD